MEPTKKIYVDVPADIKKRFREIVERNGESMTGWIRTHIDELLAQSDKDAGAVPAGTGNDNL